MGPLVGLVSGGEHSLVDAFCFSVSRGTWVGPARWAGVLEAGLYRGVVVCWDGWEVSLGVWLTCLRSRERGREAEEVQQYLGEGLGGGESGCEHVCKKCL